MAGLQRIAAARASEIAVAPICEYARPAALAPERPRRLANRRPRPVQPPRPPARARESSASLTAPATAPRRRPTRRRLAAATPVWGRAATRARGRPPRRGECGQGSRSAHIRRLHCRPSLFTTPRDRGTGASATEREQSPPAARNNPRAPGPPPNHRQNDDFAALGGGRAVLPVDAAGRERARSPDAINPVGAKSPPKAGSPVLTNVSTRARRPLASGPRHSSLSLATASARRLDPAARSLPSFFLIACVWRSATGQLFTFWLPSKLILAMMTARRIG